MMNMQRALLLLVLLSMAAEVVDTADPTSTKDFNIGRAFAHCTKLTKNNYDIWFTGLISTLVGITGIKALKTVQQFLEYFETSGGTDENTITTGLKGLVAGAATYDEADTLLFTIIQSSIDGDKEPQLAKTATMTKYRGNGVSFLKHLFDKIGPGSLSRQTAKKLRLQGETQQETETGEQFCDRLIMRS